MRQVLTLTFSILFFGVSNAQNIYSKAFGDKQNPAILFIHGGPSGNSNLFEGTTAEILANKGFYVIVYDRRGEGRSKDESATMTFEESFNDINQILNLYNLKKVNILGHSFGGIIATLFTQKFPNKVNSLTLAGALFSQQETYDHILANSKINFKSNKSKLIEISEIENLNKNSAAYRKKCFDLASEMDYFTMPNETNESLELRKKFEESNLYKTTFRNVESPIKFYKNESKNNIENTNILKEIKKNKIPIYAIYGKNDGIFSDKQLETLRNIVGKQNFKILDNCSHYLFVDQQDQFLKFIIKNSNNFLKSSN